MSVKPEPKIVSEVCTICGLDWKRHEKNPTSEKCIALLLDEVRSLNAQLAVRPARPYPLPYTYASNVTARTPQIVSGQSRGLAT